MSNKDFSQFEQKLDQIIRDIPKYRKIRTKLIKQGERIIKLLDQLNSHVGKIAQKVGVNL
ncbi:hypothetical protein KKH13_03525 [Patescibacteria group bacterium]|nr:hypothetical protein [Patescibacteria group bacterium]